MKYCYCWRFSLNVQNGGILYVQINSYICNLFVLKTPFAIEKFFLKSVAVKMDAQKFSERLPGFPWSKYKGEKHLPGHNYTGPGTNLKMRLDENDQPRKGEEPINRIDAAALKHDIIYRDFFDKSTRHQADREMIREIQSIQNPTQREILEAAVVIPILKAKLAIGAALSDRYADEIHKEYRKPKVTLKVKVHSKDSIWSADLIEMPKDNNYKFILTIIDLYTRYAWVIALTRKTGTIIKDSFEQLFKQSERKPKYLWTDRETEFYNKTFQYFLKQNDITLYSTENEGKAVVVGRFNRTFKSMMFKEFTKQGNKKWLNLLNELINRCRNKTHSTIKVTPQFASDNPEKIKEIIEEENCGVTFIVE